MSTPAVTTLQATANSIFAHDAPKFSAKDSKRLRPHLGCSRKLNEILVMDTVTDDDLRRLIVLEMHRSRGGRKVFLKKLTGRLVARARARILAAQP